VGRRRKAIDPEQVLKLGRLGCTNAEIADILGCSDDTLERRFAGELASARASRKMSLRRAQTYRAVRDRSDTMLIHLGKHELGQNDAQEQSGMTREQLDEVLAAIIRAKGGDSDGSGPGTSEEP
jgi:hypothetical protein